MGNVSFEELTPGSTASTRNATGSSHQEYQVQQDRPSLGRRWQVKKSWGRAYQQSWCELPGVPGVSC
jgi:hypothetical protein